MFTHPITHESGEAVLGQKAAGGQEVQVEVEAGNDSSHVLLLARSFPSNYWDKFIKRKVRRSATRTWSGQ